MSSLESNKYLTFSLGRKKYAIKTSYLLEIVRLPRLEYPQRLPNNTLGLLRYLNFTINIFDLRFYLGLEVTPYSTSSQVLILNTYEAIFGLIVDDTYDLIDLESDMIEHLNYNIENKIIDFLYPDNQEKISVINLENFLELTKKDLQMPEFNVLELFPQDKKSMEKFNHQCQLLNSSLDLTQYTKAQEYFLGFKLENENFCVNLGHVKEIINKVTVTKVPTAMDKILGIIVKADDFIPVFDLKQILGMQKKIAETKTIALSYLDFDFAILIDEILGDFLDLSKVQMLEPRRKYVENDFLIGEKTYSLINLEQILQEQILKEDV